MGVRPNTVLRVTVPQVPGARVRVRRGGSAWEVKAERIHAVQELAVQSVAIADLTELDITIARWRPPIAGWIGRPGLPGIRDLSVAASGSGVRLRLSTHEPTDAALLLAAAVRCLRPVPTGDLGPMLTFAPGLPASAASLAGDVRDVLREDEKRDRHVRRSDVLLVPDVDPDLLPERESTVRHRNGDLDAGRPGVRGQRRPDDPPSASGVGRPARRPSPRRTVEGGSVRLTLGRWLAGDDGQSHGVGRRPPCAPCWPWWPTTFRRAFSTPCRPAGS